MTDAHGIIIVKATRYRFPGLIQLHCQLLYRFSAVSGVSQRTTDGHTLSLPFPALKQLPAWIAPAVAVFQPDVTTTQCILKTFQQAYLKYEHLSHSFLNCTYNF